MLKTNEQIIAEFRESEMARYHPVSEGAWELTKRDIESFILEILKERDKEGREMVEGMKGNWEQPTDWGIGHDAALDEVLTNLNQTK